MVTTRRNDGEVAVSTFKDAGVKLLERNAPETYDARVASNQTESEQDAGQRMRSNLDRLLNYDRYSEVEASAAQPAPAVTEEAVSEPVVEAVASSDEDIRPTSTTMQFGDADLDQMYKEMNRAESNNHVGYKLNAKGKVVVAIYAAIVAIIFALIVLNTGVLTTLSRSNTVKAETLTVKAAEYDALTSEIERISSVEHVIEVAENDLGMVKR